VTGPARARLADLARQAGVSEATVSRVLNDKPGVSPDTRQAVLTALDVLGYERPERLHKRSAGLVGLVALEGGLLRQLPRSCREDGPFHHYFPEVVASSAVWGPRGATR